MRAEGALTHKSPAEFFKDNKEIAGFDNAGKSLYTTLRELVENALDAAEALGALPVVDVAVQEIPQGKFNKLVGLDANAARKDAALYDDYETDAQKAKRVAKEEKAFAREEKAAAKKGGGEQPAKPAKQGAKEGGAGAAAKKEGNRTYYRVTVKDNGMGMEHAEIPNMLGRVLSSTKYGVKQTRGKFGLGAKMALIWSKMSTGLPIDVRSARCRQNFVSHYVLDIDIHKNQPNVHAEERLPNAEGWHGTQISATIEGNWSTYRSYILTYMRLLAVITPYADLHFRYVADDPAKSFDLAFRRRTDVMPAVPRETKHHPSSVDQLLVRDLASTTSAKTLVAFLSTEFTSIQKAHAQRLVAEMGEGFDPSMRPQALAHKQVVRLHQLFGQARFADPDPEFLSPAGEYNLRLGVHKELQPEYVSTHCSAPATHDGHAFVVEAAVSIGGREVKPGVNVFRFANRIPLLFEAGNDVATRCAQRFKWNTYKIDKNNDKIGVFVSIVSTKIPFKGTGKEYIGDDSEELKHAVEAALRSCAAQLRAKIARKQARKERAARKKNLFRYIPDAARAIFGVLDKVAARDDPPAKRQRLLDASARAPVPGAAHEAEGTGALLEQVRRAQVTEAVLRERLQQHVEQQDEDQALEYAMQQGARPSGGGGAPEATRVYLVPLGAAPAHACTVALDHPTGVLQLLA